MHKFVSSKTVFSDCEKKGMAGSDLPQRVQREAEGAISGEESPLVSPVAQTVFVDGDKLSNLDTLAYGERENRVVIMLQNQGLFKITWRCNF